MPRIETSVGPIFVWKFTVGRIGTYSYDTPKGEGTSEEEWDKRKVPKHIEVYLKLRGEIE